MMHDADRARNNRQFNLSILSGAIAFLTAISGHVQGAEIEEVVVTAQKRAENLQDVPIAITAFTGDNIKESGVKNLTDLGKYTPGVEMHNDVALQPIYSIRGIQTNDWTAGSDPAVAVYVDGVYTGRGAGAEIPLTDIERVEVLKGPQGTLFGRNATGGAIHIITIKPQAENSTELNYTLGNFGRQSSDLVLNRQLTDGLYGRFSASTNRRDAFADNLAGGFSVGDQDTQTYRASVLWEPTTDTELLWRADYGIMDQGSALATTIVPSLKGETDLFGDYALDTPTIEDRDAFGTSLTITSDFDAFTLTSITAYRKFDAYLQEDEDGTANPDYFFGSINLDKQEQFSQEFRLNGASGDIKWTLGASYLQEKLEHTTHANFTSGSLESFAVYELAKLENPDLTQTEQEDLAVLMRQNFKELGFEGIASASFVYDLMLQSGQVDQLLSILNPAGGVTGNMLYAPAVAAQMLASFKPWIESDIPWNESVHNTGDYRSSAIYGDMTWSITDRMDLTIGARYTYDSKDFTIETEYKNHIPLKLSGGDVPLVDAEGNIIGAITLPQIDLGSQLFGIAFYNNSQPALDSKLSDSWSDISGRIVLDYRWTEEVMTYVSLADGFKAGGFNSLNFGPGVTPAFDQEDVVNLEAGLKSNLFDNRVRLNASVYTYEYNNLQTLDLVGVPIPSYNLRNADAEGTGAEIEVQWVATDNFFIAGNYSYLDTEFTDYQIIEVIGETEADSLVGEPRVSTPENKLNLMAEYSVDLASGGQLLLRGDYNRTDERIGSVTDRARIVEDYQLFNLRAAWNSASENYSVALWVQNLTDEEIAGGFGGSGAAIGASPGWRLVPRMYGADFTVRF
ncbi:TonB-dependent receptor [Microbulbifer sp. 2205BS26-8]|uniref:TonB-dependent receptor n=1 Tax=Microbulbifer sp. 2205BS26-8 TaxID=3064386 RepID=UPI00273FD835|nr:TonB-dependent receptor [Microbulbifer sp. 2205BS26-8]MDP5208305.1 TonB-dependent receptor [Microbulbifer sp. 2205BS26-8]